MHGYAVIDFETTGLVPERSDRVVEVGVVLSDDAGRIEDEWTTLVNPHRDLGPSHIHGIRAADVLDAPDFTEIAGHLLTLLAGRTVVAHNAVFDMRFLHAELGRADYEIDQRPPALCSMRWAGRVLGSAKLAHCCKALGIELANAHAALDDARATAQLVTHLQKAAGSTSNWLHDRELIEHFGWPRPRLRLPAIQTKIARRSHPAATTRNWLDSVLTAAWIPGRPEDEASYLVALDRALLDRSISLTEGRELLSAAQSAGLTGSTVARLHRDYLRSVAQVAMADGVLTPQEEADLGSVADALRLPPDAVGEALAWAAAQDAPLNHEAFSLQPGDRIVFTGDMQRGRDEWTRLITASGLTTGAVTKKTKLLVAADPDSLSGKAAKARAYGIPVVDEEAFERLFAAYIPH